VRYTLIPAPSAPLGVGQMPPLGDAKATDF